jgi:DNA-binding IclR family transcriptional regulator
MVGLKATRNTTLQKGLAILETMAMDARELSLAEVASLTGLEKSRACRLLQTLAGTGYVVQDPKSRRYRIGLRTLELSSGILSNMPLYRAGVAYLHDVSDRLNAPSYLGVLHLGKVLTIATVYPAGVYVEGAPGFGTVMKLEESAMGKVLLAHADRVREAGGADRSHELAQELGRVAEAGFATIMKGMGSDSAVAGVAAPVRSGQGSVIAALGASVSGEGWAACDQERFIGAVRRGADGLSFALGWVAGRLAAAQARFHA